MNTKKDVSGPKGSSPDLMPSIMGAFDAYLQQKHEQSDLEHPRTSTPKRSHQLNNFASLSPCVQKILSNVPEQEISKKFSSEETLGPRRNRFGYRSLRNTEKVGLNRSNESLDIISPGVHKMLSNLQDSELVISTSNLHISTNRTSVRNHSYLYSRTCELNRSKKFSCHYESSTNYNQNSSENDDQNDTSVSLNNATDLDGSCGDKMHNSESPSDVRDNSDNSNVSDSKFDVSDEFVPMPLGSYLHSEKGIASRTPVGRINMGKYLQVPSESSGVSANTNSTASSLEVSRPVSLTSLGSCSSSGSSNGHHQPGSAYLASAESLDSDPEPAGSQGSADSGIAEQEQPSINPEQRVLQEVLDTETAYVADLNEVIQGYLELWRRDLDCPLTEYLHDLFSNLEEIYEFNKKILEDLRKADMDPTKTANVFLQHDSGFKVYNEYCAYYPRTMEVLSNLQKDPRMAPLFKEKQQLLGHALPLGSYLLKPVQRILKYHLLLQRMSKQCEPPHKPAVDLALTTMTSVASDINNMKRKHEDAVRVQEIQSQLYGWTGADLTTLGELIAEGTFRVQGARGRRHVFLFEKVLLLAKSKTDGALAYKMHIECSNLMLVEQVRGEPLSFQVLPFDNPRLQCTLRARSPHHKREWTLQIKRVILENYSAVIPNHARQLVMQLGQDVTETDDTPERWSPLKHSATTPHYLERRSRVRRTRDLSKDRRAASQDRTFPSLGSWRRKSEPSMIPQQYDSKVVPKKISKLKKTKENGSSTFYTDLSDSENCDLAAESVESLARTEEKDESREEISPKTIENNLEKIVSELLMQNQDFHKVFNREHMRHPRRNINSEPGPIWYDERPQLPSKADSLPRSFQLNDSTDNGEGKDGGIEKGEFEKQRHENDLSSRLDDTDHPDHKIYRKSAIRLSLLQRIRMIMSEEQRKNNKYPLYKQGGKSMGEKIAHPDYVDPHKLFVNSRNNSQVSLSLESGNTSHDVSFESQEDIMGERVQLDMSLNEKEVLKELEKRLSEGKEEKIESSQSKNENISNKSLNSSRNSPSDSYYESILDNSLKEEYVRDKTGKLVVKSDSFTNNDRLSFSPSENCTIPNIKQPLRVTIKRPIKAPPPIPAKPLRLTKHGTNQEKFTKMPDNSANFSSTEGEIKENGSALQTSWVKTMVGRFE